jgi:uncharacterized protein (DUF58 family)
VLAFSAISNNDKVGLIAFTDRVERYVPPRKGARHGLRLVRDLLYFQPARRGTSIREGLDYLNRVMRRRAIVFLFSDFLDTGFEPPLKQAGRRHDLIAVRITDRREKELPSVGLLELEDAETRAQVLLDTRNAGFREAFAEATRRRLADFAQLAQWARIDLVDVSTEGNHLEALVRFFRLRERRLRRI